MKNIKITAFITLMIFFYPGTTFGLDVVKIGPLDAKINSSIKYSVIGRYRAVFDQYTGQIELDREKQSIRSVRLSIDAASIRSNCGWCDKIVRSKQLLHVERYPKIIFQSREVTKGPEGYVVKGDLDLHGETKELSFPFEVTGIDDSMPGDSQINAKGQWLINRKEFKIIWNRLLDKGGVLVGDTIRVDWEVNIDDQK